jgi:hypothetical protein
VVPDSESKARVYLVLIDWDKESKKVTVSESLLPLTVLED